MGLEKLYLQSQTTSVTVMAGSERATASCY